MSNTGASLRRLFLGGAAFGALTLSMGAAVAQTTEQPTAEDKAKEQAAAAAAAAADNTNRVTITGSLIRRDEFNTASPVQVITNDESTLAGLASTAEMLQSTGVTGGNNQANEFFGGFVVDGGPGVNTLSLRGLGPTRTLVLLNGRRLAPAGSRGSVGSADLNVLPSSIVNRIEILKDGASSIYGSDAVAGVVNIITESKVDGLNFEVQGNKSEHGGADAFNASISTGFNDVNYRLSGSVEYYERTPMRLKDRDWTVCNVDGFRDPTTGASLDTIDPVTGQPKCYPISTTGSNGVTINTLGTPTTAGVGATGSAAGQLTFNRWRPNSAVTTGLTGFEGVGGGATGINVRDVFEPEMLEEMVISPTKNLTAFGQAGFDLGMLGNAELYVEGLYSERKSNQDNYRQISLDYPANGPTAFGTTSNLLPTQINAIAGNFLGAQAKAPYITKARAFIGYGIYGADQEVAFTKLTSGLRGDFILSDWTYDASLSYSKSDAQYSFEQILQDRLNSSMNSCPTVVPANVSQFFDTTSGNCVIAPALSSGVLAGNLPQAWLDYVTTDIVGKTVFEETTLTSLFSGPLFQLPAGEVAGAFGLEYRKSKLDDAPDPESVNGNLFGFSSSVATQGEDSVQEAFAEVEAPLLSGVPFADDLTLNVSARYTDYDSYGSDETYKVGLTWKPMDWLLFRAAQGTSFRAPAIFEQYLGATSGFLSNTVDPCHDYGSRPTTTIRFINCNAEINNTAYLSTQSVRTVSAGGAAQGLSAETSDNTSIGVVVQPPLPSDFGDFSFAIDYYNIEVKNQVSRVGAGALISLCYDDPDFRAGGSYCNFSTRDPATNAFTVFDNYINQATQIVEGYDFNIRYTKDIGPGTFRLNAEIRKYEQQADKLFDTDPLDDVNGNINSPEMTAEADFTYDVGDYRFFWRTNWIKEQDSYEYLGEDPATSIFDFNVPDYFLHSASVRYTSEQDFELTFGIRNVFDEKPPTISAGFYNRVGNAPLYSGYDYIGRQAYVNIAKKF